MTSKLDWSERPFWRGVIIVVAVVVMAAIGGYFIFYQGEPRVQALLRERANLSADQALVLQKVGPFTDQHGVTDWSSALWCGWVSDQPDRHVAAVESKQRRGLVNISGGTLGWAPRSARERQMIIQCARMSGPPSLP